VSQNPERIRILRIINRAAIGGPILNATLLTRELPDRFETKLLVGPCEEKYNHIEATDLLEGLDCVRLPSMRRSPNPLRDVETFLAIRKLIRQYKPHIVHTHATKPGTLGRLAAKLEGVPVVVHTFHGHVFHSYFNPLMNSAYRILERQLARISDAIVAISAELKKEMSTDFKIAPTSKFHIVPLGFDLDKFFQDPLSKRSQFRKELGVSEDTVVITLVGRLVPIKNHGFFLRAFKRLKELTDRKVLAVFVGYGEGYLQVEAEVKTLGIEYARLGEQTQSTELIFTFLRTDVDVVYAGSDIIALSSLNEGTPVSLVEALASEKPVVSTRVGGVESIVEHGVTGFLCDKSDTESFAHHLATLVNDDALRIRMGKAGPGHVRTRFSYQRLVSDMEGLYEELLRRKGVKVG